LATEAGVGDEIHVTDTVLPLERGRRFALPRVRIGRRTMAVLVFARDWHGLLLAGALGLIAAFVTARVNHFVNPAFDDSYITLTFARNLADHGMLSFDGHTWSTGATSPLHVMILAAVLKAGGAPLFSSVAVGFASHVLLCMSVWWLTLAIFHNRLAAILGALAMAWIPYATFDVVNGLETGLFMALVTATVASYLSWRGRKGRIATGWLLALGILCRPEGAFLVPALVLYRWIERKKGEPMREYIKDVLSMGLPACVGLGIVSGYSFIVNGSLSGTATVKMQFFQENKFPLREKIAIAGDNISIFLGPVLTLCALALIPRRRELALVLLFWAPILVLYTLLFPGSLFHYFYRYQHPILPFIAVFAAGGAYQLLAIASQRDILVKLMVGVASFIVIVPLWQHYDRWRDLTGGSMAEQRYDLSAMAQELNTLVLPSQTLATHDIGTVGYYAKYKVMDLVGLVNPDIVPYHDGRRVPEYLAKNEPDFILIFPGWDYDYLHIDPNHYKDKYQYVAEFKGGPIRKYSYFLWRVVHTKDRPWYPGEQLQENPDAEWP